MKKVISNLRKKLHNAGSSIVLVIVALAFVGILTGALLTAVAYAYRQKLYDYNAKSNFYYLDQAMDEIYAGVGSKTMNSLAEAYEKTRESIIQFDLDTKSYKNIDNAIANDKFKSYFMDSVSSGSYTVVRHTGTNTYKKYDGTSWVTATEAEYKSSIVYDIENMISDSKVKLDSSNMSLRFVYVDNDGKPKELPAKSVGAGILSKIVLKNVKLSRTVEYNRSTAKGEFTQSISTDIEISRPDFEVDFGNNVQDVSTLFDYCVIADSGVDFNRTKSDVLTMHGNVYAANDFYNKAYNNYEGNPSDEGTIYKKEYTDSNNVKYKMNKVSNYTYSSDNPDDTTLYNKNFYGSYDGDGSFIVPGDKKEVLYNGLNDKSKYSGLYIDGGNVNILADTVIVPGSISVMNGGNLSVYGMSSSDNLSRTDVWADEIVLAGYSLPYTNDTKKGSSASFNSNLYILDDTQIESEYSKFKLTGTYFGYSNSVYADNREFIPTVAKSSTNGNYNVYQHQVVLSDGTVKAETKGHYNSSSILVNGQYSDIDLSGTEKLFIAGRAYIELSNVKTGSSIKYASESKSSNDINQEDYNKLNDEAKKDYVEYNLNSYQNNSELEDYKTGESVSIKSTQLSYYPGKASGALDEIWDVDVDSTGKYFVRKSDGELPIKDKDGNSLVVAGTGAAVQTNYLEYTTHFELSSGTSASSLRSMRLFTKYFGFDGSIPVLVQKTIVNGKLKTYYYFDFDQAVRDHKYDTTFFPAGDTDVDKAKYNYIPNYAAASDAEKAEIDAEIWKYSDVLKRNFIKDYFDYFNFCVNKNSIKKMEYMGYEENYDDFGEDNYIYSVNYALSNLPYAAFKAKYEASVDLSVLETINNREGDGATPEDVAEARKNITNKVNELQDVTNFQEFLSGQIAIPYKDDDVLAEDNSTKVDAQINTSGAITRSDNKIKDLLVSDYDDIQYNLTINENSNISSTLLGEHTETTGTDKTIITQIPNGNDTASKARVLDFAANYREHYDVVKWALKDLNEDTAEYTFLRDTIASDAGDEKEAFITPLNYYLNFDQLTGLNIKPGANATDLDLGEYKVWASEGNVTVADGDNSEITGIVIAKGDVFFGSNVTRFNGLIITGGKVYIMNNTNDDLSVISSTKLCKNIINECITKASSYKTAGKLTEENITEESLLLANDQALNAIKFLKLFKAYEGIAKKAEKMELSPDETKKDITNIDYSDIVRYNNWVRNVD